MKIGLHGNKIRGWLMCLAVAVFGCLTWQAWAAFSKPAQGYRIALVLPREQGPIERAFLDYFSRRGVAVQTSTLLFSGKAEDQPALVKRLRELKPDLIYTWGTPTTLAVAGPFDASAAERRRYIRDTPIVFTSIANPLAARLVKRLDKPGRNLTGASHLAPLPSQLKTISAYRSFKTLGLMYNPREANSVAIRDALLAQAVRDHFTVRAQALPLAANGEPDVSAIPHLVHTLKAQGADFLYIGPDTFIGLTHRELVTQSALEAGLPSFSAIESPVRTGKALFGLFSPQANVGRFAAVKALSILAQGKPVGDIPIETLQHFSLLINMEVARALELYPPLMLLNVADVIAEKRINTAIGPVALR